MELTSSLQCLQSNITAGIYFVVDRDMSIYFLQLFFQMVNDEFCWLSRGDVERTTNFVSYKGVPLTANIGR